jgi:hypothetical protein
VKKLCLNTLLLFCFFSYSQKDSLILKNGLISVVHITRLEKNEVFFVIPGDESNTVHAVNRSQLKKICLHTKIVEVVDSLKIAEVNKLAKEDSIANFIPRSLVGISLSSLMLSNISLSFQYINKQGNVAWKLQTSLNVAPSKIKFTTQYSNGFLGGGWPNYLTKNLKFYLNCELHYFLTKQQKISWYVGHGLQFGFFDYSYYTNSQYLLLPAYVPMLVEKKNAFNIVVYAQTGIIGRVTENIYVEVSLAGGLQRTTFKDAIPRIDPFAFFQFSGGYSFNFKKKKTLNILAL